MRVYMRRGDGTIAFDQTTIIEHLHQRFSINDEEVELVFEFDPPLGVPRPEQ